MTPEIICKNCRFGTPAVGSSNETVCHRRSSTRYTFLYNHWCAEGEWRRDGDWTSWYDIMDMEEAVTKELKRDWRGQGEPLDD